MKKETEIFELQLPNLDFLRFGNKYSGGYGNFNFKIIPEISEFSFEVFVWVGFSCLDRSRDFYSKCFKLNEQGCEQAQNWVFNEFERLTNVNLS